MLANLESVAIIGSRTLPEWLDSQVERLAHNYVDCGTKIITGGAPGTDQAAIRGAAYNSNVKVYLPWSSFEEINLMGVACEVTQDMEDPTFIKLLEYYYKVPVFTMKQSIVKLMARNYSIIKDAPGVIAFPRMKDGDPTGGTAFGIYLARSLNKELEVHPIDSLNKWDVCPTCSMHTRIWNCGARFHELKPYV